MYDIKYTMGSKKRWHVSQNGKEIKKKNGGMIN